MAFRREEQKIIPGGINLLPPGDQIADGDCLQMQCFRPDAAGSLIQTLGLTASSPVEGLFQIHSILRLKDEQYYGGSSYLWKLGHRSAPDPPGSISSAFDGTPLGLAGFQDFAWAMNRGAQKKVKYATMTPYGWTTETPTIPAAAAGAGGSLPDGQTLYYVTFDTDDYHEGNLSPAQTVVVTAPNSTYTITRPARTEGIVTGWHVYRMGLNHAQPYRVNIAPIPYATTFLADDGAGDKSDDAIRDRDQAHSGDHDAAPAAAIIADKPYDGRLLVANSAAHPNRVWYSNSLEPWYFPGSGNPQDGNWVDIGEDDAVLAITVKPQMCLVYKERGVWRIRGDIADGLIELIAPDLGTVGRRSVCATGQGDYFVSKEGLAICTGDFARKLPWSSKLDVLFRGEQAQIATGIVLNGVDGSYRDACAIGHRNGRLWFSYTSTAAATHNPDTTFVVDLATGRIANRPNTEFDSGGGERSGFSVFYDEGQVGNLLAGGPGEVYTLESTYKDDGNTMSVAWHSRYEDQGAPDQVKTYGDLVIIHNTRGAALTVTAFENNGILTSDKIVIGTITSTSRTRTEMPLVYPVGDPNAGKPIPDAYNLAIRIEGTASAGASLPIQIDAPILLHYYVHPRKAKTFDSDETDHGIADVKGVDQVELDINNSDNTAALQVYSNIPGGVMAARLGAGLTVPKTTGRQMVIMPLGSIIDGRLLRYSLKSNATGANEGFLLYGARARVYRYGEYLDGGNTGEVWRPLPTAVGV